MHSSFRAVLAGSAAAALLAAPSFAQKPAQDFSGRALTQPPRTSWPTNGGNLYNQRYSPLREINTTNVGTLKGVWRARLNGSGASPQYSGEAQPIVYDGVAYISTGANDVFALSLDDGKVLWQYEAHLDPNLTSVCCGWTSRGVTLGEGKVFAGQLDGKLVALDRKTGKVAWSIQAERWQENFSITAAPVYVDGKVIVGFAGADRGTRGRVKAYDARNGKLLWTFYTIPGPGEPGHESWPKDNDAWKYGGGSIWQTPAVDPELGLVYFSTGNAGPDYNGAYRAGDNLYTSSIVAVDLGTGQYRWHFQQVHHDIWDYDAPNPVVLFDVRIGGQGRQHITSTRALRHRGHEFSAGRVCYLFDGQHLWYSLPSGRVLCYPFARLDAEGVSYAKASWKPAADATEWPRARLWRGLAVENITQATANDILRYSLRQLDDTVLHIHDEIVLEVPERVAEARKQQLYEIMCSPPAWAQGLPLDAEIKIQRRYGK